MPGPRQGYALSPKLIPCIALLGAASFIYYHQVLFMPRVAAASAANGIRNRYSLGNDFFQVWFTSKELLEQKQNPYNRETTLQIQQGLYGRSFERSRPHDPIDQQAFVYPAYADLIFWPATELSFSRAARAMLCILTGLSIASVLLWLRALEWRLSIRWKLVAILLALSTFPALEGLVACQLGLFVSFLLAASVLSFQRGRFFLAGSLMALSTIKPQAAALLIVYLLLWSLHRSARTRMFWVGFASTISLLLGASLLVLPGWIPQWISAIGQYRRYTRPALVTEVLTSWMNPSYSASATLIVTVLILALAITLAWRNRTAEVDSLEFWLTLTILLTVTTVAVLPGQAIYDHLILTPGILLLFRYRSEFLKLSVNARILAFVGLFTFTWPWIASLFVVGVRIVRGPAMIDSPRILLLPLRSQAPLPFIVLALLGWFWRVHTRQNQATS